MKKGQVQAQIFVYVLAMLVIGLVLLYGYKSIGTMQERAKQVDILGLKNEIMKSIEKVSNDYGTVRAPTLNVPEGYAELCFIDLDHSPASDLQSEHPLVYEAWEDKSANVFLIKELADESFLVGEEGKSLIDIVNPNYICFQVINNRVKIRLEGTGGQAQLSSPE